MDVSAAGSAIYASFGSANADSLTGSIRRAAQTDRDGAGAGVGADLSLGGAGGAAERGGRPGIVTAERGNNVNLVV